jgi:hypothetical protein
MLDVGNRGGVGVVSDEFDASAAAARAVGRQADGELKADQDAGADDAGETSSTSSGGDGSTTDEIVEMFRSTEPDPSLDEVESPWDPDRGGLARIYRGLRKMVGIDGTPAWLDLSIGSIEIAVDVRDREASDDDQEASPEPGGADTI